MKEIKIPIISGLSIAATLALLPIQVLAKDGQVTVTTDGHTGNFYNSSGKNFSGGFESSVGTYGQNDNNIVTITGVDSGGRAMWDYTIYGGGNGDGTPTTPPFYYKQTSAAENNTLNVYEGATVAVLVGGEGKGAKNNTVNLIDADVNNVVLGGNGTWYGQADSSGDAIHNIVNISGSTQVKYNNFINFNSTSVMGGRATGTNKANNNEVNIKGTPTIAGRIAGAAVENGDADSNKVDINAIVNLANVSGVIASKDSTATLQNNIVTINNDGAVVTDVLVANGTGGGIHGPGGKATAKNNHGKLIKGTVGNLNGAYMVRNTEKNHSTIEGGHVTNYAYGSYYRNDAHDLKSNSKGDYVTISGGTVDKATYGAFTYYGDIDGAHVDMSGGKVVGTNVAGDDGVFGGLSYDGTVNNSYLDLSGGEISGDAIGGRSNNKDVTHNYAKINGSAKIGGRLIGGESRGGTASDSYLDLTGGEIGGDSIGSLGSTGAVGGKIIASGTKFNGNVIGGKSSSGNVTGSRVTLTNVTASKNVIGGEAQSGNTDDNQVSLIGGSVTGDVYGAKASGTATNSVVNLSGAQVAGNVYAAHAANGSGNKVNFYSGSVTKTIYGLSSAGGTNNTLNVYNASTQKTAGDIKNFNTLNFDGISSANGSAATASLNLHASAVTDINDAKFQLDGTDYNVDTYAIGDGEKRYLIHNENGFTGFDETQTTKRTDNVFTIKNATTYSMNLKGLMKDDDGKSIVIQGKKKTDRTITGAFDSGEITKYSGPAGNPTIDVGENPNAPENFGGLDIDTNNVPNATINLVSGDDIGEIRANDDDTINVGKDSNNPLVPGKITAKNISGAGKLNFNVPDGFSGSDTALTLTDGNPTDLSGTKISVNSDKLADNTQYTLINKTNGTINQLDRTIQKDQVYTIKNANEYSFVGESYKTDASLKKLQYSKGTQTRNWDGEFDYGETELNKITNAANNGHSLDRNKNNTVIIDANAGNLNGKKIYGGSTAAGDTLDIHDNTVEINGGTNIGDVIAGNNASSSGKVSNNVINFNAGTLSGKLYGSDDASNARGNNSGNTLNVNNASTQKTAGDIKNFNALNFDGVTAATNGSAATAALNLTTNANTDINNAKFKLNGEEYDVNKDTYHSLNIEEGKEYYLIHNAGNTFTGFKEKAKQTDNEFTITGKSSYEINLKGLIQSADNQSILVQGKKLTGRNISSDGKFDNEEISKYTPDLSNGANINVGKTPGANKDFEGLDIDTSNTPGVKSKVTLVDGKNIGTIKGDADDTVNVGKTDGSLVPGTIEAKNIVGVGKLNFNMPNGYNGDPALKLTGSNLTDLSNTDVKINNAQKDKDYTLIKGNAAINFQDKTTQKEQVYNIIDNAHYQYDGETFRKQNNNKELIYREGTITDAWNDNDFDSNELTKNKADNAHQGGTPLFDNKGNTVNIVSTAGDLSTKSVYGGATLSGSTDDVFNNTVNINGADTKEIFAGASKGSGRVYDNVVNFNAGSVVNAISGSDDASNARGNNNGNTLNVNNAHTQKTAGDIKNFNALNFDGVTAATNGAIDKAALNLTTNADTDINNAKFKLNGEEYDVDKDTYGSLNIEEGKEYHLIRNGGNTFTNFTEKAKQTTREFTLRNSTTYDIMLKGLIKSSDDQSILIQGSKLTSRNITGGEFGNDEINRYNPIPNPVINVVNEDPNNPTNFNGLNINGGNNSTVNLTGGNNIGDITGGAGSTLNVGKNPTNPAAPNSITARNIGGFDDINIFMPPTIKDGDSMITLTDPTANTDLSNMRGKITAYISGNTDVGDTSTIHLIDKQGSGRLLLPDPSHLQTRVQQGATIEYETYGMVDANGRALDLRFSGKRRIKDDTKSFAETRAASLASLKSGSELITNYLDKLIPDGHLELFPFAISEAYSLRHETGSHVNSKGYGVAAGLASLTDNFAGDILSGVFVEYGKANYDSYLDSGLHADGDSEYIGGGLMLKQNFTSGTYLDASFHVGKISSDYNSNDWTYAIAPGVLAHNEKFDISSTYMATHIGIGQIFDLSQSNKLDVYTKWLYAYTDDADATISSGERYHFDSVTSNRVRAGLRDTINLKDEHNLYVGGAYEYEFKGDAKASTMGLDAPKPSLKGSTGVFEAGYKYESKNLILSLGGKGYVGKTRGGAINAGFEVMF